MYQKAFRSQMRLLATCAAGALAIALGASAASADTAKCIASISKNTAKYEEAVQKSLGKCRASNTKDSTKTPSCPDAKASDKISKALTKLQDKVTGDCGGETPATLGFTGLVDRCNGGSRTGLFCTRNSDCEGQCGSGAEIGAPCTADSNCPNTCFGGSANGESCKGGGATVCTNGGGVCNNPANAGHCNAPAGGTCDPADRCPNVVDDSAPFGNCDGPMASLADVSTCLACNANSTANAITGFAYGARRPSSDDPAFGIPTGDEKDVLNCNLALGKGVGGYFQAVRKATQKCTASLLKGKVPSCPDSKATDAIAKAKTKLTDAISKKCGGTLFAETAKLGTVLSLDPLADTLALPNSGTAFGDATAALANALATCSDSAAVPSALTDTCRTNCGNGQIDPGEDCDDGNVVNGDTCPANCVLDTTCSVTGTVTVTVNVTAPSTPLGALTTYLAYNDTKVNLPGSGSAATAAITAGAFGVSANDLDSGVRVVLVDPSDIGTPPYTIQFNVCSGASVTAADFSCMVEDAADAATATNEYGVTCSVTVM